MGTMRMCSPSARHRGGLESPEGGVQGVPHKVTVDVSGEPTDDPEAELRGHMARQ
jgi:LDH2 family malate/lactate/ureidoglycolate dehydrogenase